MREITVSAWDDVHLTEDGQRIPADPASSATLKLDDREIELDLTPEHRADLEADLARWFKAGARSETPSWKMSPRQRHPLHADGLTPLQAARRYNGEMHRWAAQVDPEGVKYKITKGYKGKPYYPENLRNDFAAHLASQAGSPEG